MIVVDGRTDREKLFELLKSGGECSELDFKETLDFSKKIDELDFVKDAVSMCNRYPGGYIVIGWTMMEIHRLELKIPTGRNLMARS